MNYIDDAMQHLMQQKSEKEEALALGEMSAHLETLKKPITFRVDEMYIFFSDLLCNEFEITKGEFNRMMYENAILDAIDALGEDWKDYQKMFYESKIKQKEAK